MSFFVFKKKKHGTRAPLLKSIYHIESPQNRIFHSAGFFYHSAISYTISPL